MSEPFVLDAEDNPHPRMKEKALALRAVARLCPLPPTVPTHELMRAWWLGYLDCMSDATGLPAVAIEAWLNSHEQPDLTGYRAANETESDALPSQPVNVRHS